MGSWRRGFPPIAAIHPISPRSKGGPSPRHGLASAKGQRTSWFADGFNPNQKTHVSHVAMQFLVVSTCNFEIEEMSINEGSSLHIWMDKERRAGNPNQTWTGRVPALLGAGQDEAIDCLEPRAVGSPSCDAAWSIRRLTVGRVVFLHFANYIEVGSIVPMCHRKATIVCI